MKVFKAPILPSQVFVSSSSALSRLAIIVIGAF